MTIRSDNVGNQFSGTFLNPSSKSVFIGANGTVGNTTDLPTMLNRDGGATNRASISRDSSGSADQFLAWRPVNTGGVNETNPNSVSTGTSTSNGTDGIGQARFVVGRGLDGNNGPDTSEGFGVYIGNGTNWSGTEMVTRNNVRTPINRLFHLCTVNSTTTNFAWMGYDDVTTFSNLRFCWVGYLTLADRFGLATDARSRLCTLFYQADGNHPRNSRPYYVNRWTEANGSERFLRIGTDPEAEYAFDTTTVLDDDNVDATELYLKDNNGPPYGTIGYLDNLFAVKGSYNRGDVIILRQGDAGGLATANQIKGADDTVVICVAPLYHASYGVPGKYLFMRVFPNLFT